MDQAEKIMGVMIRAWLQARESSQANDDQIADGETSDQTESEASAS